MRTLFDSFVEKNPEAGRIALDIASSYIMTFIGDHMETIIEDLNKIHGREISFSYLKSKIICDSIRPRGRREDDVHWIYIDEFNKTHESYFYRMQQRGSHQFCQSYALLLAYYPEERKQSNPRDAYLKLLPLWEQLFGTYEVDVEILNEIFIQNKNEEKNKKALSKAVNYLKNFNHKKLLRIMSSDYAERTTPYF